MVANSELISAKEKITYENLYQKSFSRYICTFYLNCWELSDNFKDTDWT